MVLSIFLNDHLVYAVDGATYVIHMFFQRFEVDCRPLDDNFEALGTLVDLNERDIHPLYVF